MATGEPQGLKAFSWRCLDVKPKGLTRLAKTRQGIQLWWLGKAGQPFGVADCGREVSGVLTPEAPRGLKATG